MKVKDEHKEKINDILSDGMKPTSEISALSGINYYKTKEILKDMEDKGEVKKIEKDRGTYWEV